MSEALTPEEALEMLTGEQPAPIELTPELKAQAEKEGQMRKDHTITDRETWLKQLRKRHPEAAIPKK